MREFSVNVSIGQNEHMMKTSHEPIVAPWCGGSGASQVIIFTNQFGLLFLSVVFHF